MLYARQNLNISKTMIPGFQTRTTGPVLYRWAVMTPW